MAESAIVGHAGTESAADFGCMVNALETASAFHERDGDEVKIIFDGAATQWVPELADPDHDYYELFETLRDEVSVCGYCASAFEVDDVVGSVRLARVTRHDTHPSLRLLVEEGYEVITF